MKTVCEIAFDEAGGLDAPPGAYVPQCDEDGEFMPLQFHASSGHSWCVNHRGVEIPGTRAVPGDPPPSCPNVTSK